MILKALYDYYQRRTDLPAPGLEEKEIGFLIVITPEGRFVRFEDCRIDKKHARTFLVKKSVGRSSNPIANYLYDNSAYVLGYADPKKDKKTLTEEADSAEKGKADKNQLYLDTFKQRVNEISEALPHSAELKAVAAFYEQTREEILATMEADPLWDDIRQSLSKKYSTFSFRIDGDLKIVAEKKELLQLDAGDDTADSGSICLVTGHHGTPVKTTTATMIPGSQATAKLVAFQVKSGYDSYGKEQGSNAPISRQAEFAYTTALNDMLGKDSRHKFGVGNRTFVFWASSAAEASAQAEESLFDLLGAYAPTDDLEARTEQARKVFTAIYTGRLTTSLTDRFYILGLAPNAARIAVVYWAECPLREFAGTVLRHFNDMEIVDTRKERKPYTGIRDMLSAVTLGGKQSEATPNLPETIVRSIFQGTPYPATLFSACIRRIRAEAGNAGAVRTARAAILKAYLNRINDNKNQKINIMLDTSNTNPGYLCGRLFAVLDKTQEEANGISTIRERYMNAASATPSAVFATILNLSAHHLEKLSEGRKTTFEKLKQEIISKISADGFPAHLDLQDQGRFFIGYYHQRQDFFTPKAEKKEEKAN